MSELTAEQEVAFREELDAIHDRITTIDALTSFLVGSGSDCGSRIASWRWAYGSSQSTVTTTPTATTAKPSRSGGLKLSGQQRPRVARIVKATAHARAYLPETGRKIDTYSAERATAFATVAIAETCALVLERALATREP